MPKHKARSYADLSLQFWKEAGYTAQFTITSNLSSKNKLKCHGMDLTIFARELADFKLLDLDDKLALCKLFNTMRNEILKKLVKEMTDEL